MYHRRVKDDPRRAGRYYFGTNRTAGGVMLFGDREKEMFRQLLFDGEERHAFTVVDYCVLGNHWHAVIFIPQSDEMPRREVLRRWRKHVGNPDAPDPGDDVLEAYRRQIHDLSLIFGNIQQRFAEWVNTLHNRHGHLFGGRFDSVIVEPDRLPLVMAYIALNPVRAGIVSDPADYMYSSYAERAARGSLRPEDQNLIHPMTWMLGLAGDLEDLPVEKRVELLWEKFRWFMLGQDPRLRRDAKTVRELIEQDGGHAKLDWCDKLMLRVRFATKGIAIGSEEFVAEILDGCGKAMGYKREHRPRATGIWDDVFCLKNHRRMVEV